MAAEVEAKLSAEEDVFFSSTSVRKRYDGVSHMWIEERLKSDPTFPRPMKVGNKRFWKLSELLEWERQQLKKRPRDS
jgi:predicted DNA-binding transcriptional regulator AlpA